MGHKGFVTEEKKHRIEIDSCFCKKKRLIINREILLK